MSRTGSESGGIVPLFVIHVINALRRLSKWFIEVEQNSVVFVMLQSIVDQNCSLQPTEIRFFMAGYSRRKHI